MDEESEEDRGCAEPERPIVLRDEVQEPGGRRHQRGVDDEAEDPQLRRDRERRRMGLVAFRRQLCLRLFLARLRLSADAHADERVVFERDPRDPRETRPAARRLPGGVTHRGRCDERTAGEDRDDGTDGDHAAQHAAAEDERDGDGDGEERRVARLGVRGQQSEEQETDECSREPEANAREPRRDEQHTDRDHDVTAENARILEQRRHAKVGRVRIRPRDVAREQVAVCEALEERGGREERAERDECGRERAGVPGAVRRADDHHDERREREEEEEELDASCP